MFKRHITIFDAIGACEQEGGCWLQTMQKGYSVVCSTSFMPEYLIKWAAEFRLTLEIAIKLTPKIDRAEIFEGQYNIIWGEERDGDT